MNKKQIQLVQETFALVEPIADTAASIFYERLFEIDPSLRPLFKHDISKQGKKLMATLKLAVAGLNDLDRILPAVRSLGQRHVGYGIQPHHYDTVGAALLWTLENGLGERFTADVKMAWAETYTLLATVMQEAAAEVKPTVTAHT